jgi:uncharacterized protein RhaS with RHS repeats
MKSNRKYTALALGAFVFIVTTQVASAFYDPNLQRWINRDPIQESGGVNLYGYVGNNPISNTDPLGLDYYVIYIPAFSGFSHQVVIGDNGHGGSYVIEYGPASGGLNRIYGPGRYNYTPYTFPPNESAYDLSKARCVKTPPSVDKALNDVASTLGGKQQYAQLLLHRPQLLEHRASI